MHLVKTFIFSLNHIIVRPTKIIKDLLKNRKILIFKVSVKNQQNLSNSSGRPTFNNEVYWKVWFSCHFRFPGVPKKHPLEFRWRPKLPKGWTRGRKDKRSQIDFIGLTHGVVGNGHVVSEFLKHISGSDHRALLSKFQTRLPPVPTYSATARATLKGWTPSGPQAAPSLAMLAFKEGRSINSLNAFERFTTTVANTVPHITCGTRKRQERKNGSQSTERKQYCSWSGCG